MHILLYASGSAGDILPLVRVGGALVERGHRATLVTHAGYDALAEKAGLTYSAFDTAEQYRDFLANAAALNTPEGIGRFLKDYSLPLSVAAVRALEEHASDASLILTCPTFDVPTRLVAERTKIPLMWLFVSPVQVAAWPLRKTIRNAMYRGLLGDSIGAIRAELGMAAIDDWDRWLSYSAGSIGQWPGWFGEPEDDWVPGVKTIGFLSDHQAERDQLSPEIEQFLQRNPNPVLVTGGTGDYLGETFFAAALRAIQSNDLPVVVVTRYPERLPTALPDSTLIVEKSPFGRLMPRCGSVIHHGGLGTLGAAAGAGVPQLILAFGADRPDNGHRMSQLGIGEYVGVRNWDSDQPTFALKRLHGSEETLSRCREIRQRLIGNRASASSVAAVEDFAAAHNRS